MRDSPRTQHPFRRQRQVSPSVLLGGGGLLVLCHFRLMQFCPTAFIGNRYCIDLVCIAGEPDNGTIHVQLLGPILNASQFDPKTYVSIAPVNSGKQSYTVEIMIGGGLFFVTFGAIAVFACNVLLRAMKKKQCRGGCCKDRRAVGVPLASKAEHGEQ